LRSRQRFAEHGFLVIVVDGPSDRERLGYRSAFRQSAEHVAGVRVVIAWARQEAKVPVWLVGRSRGTLSAAYVAIELPSANGPDGLVLTSTVVAGGDELPVSAMSLGKLKMPVLVVHHEHDACRVCPYSGIPPLMRKLDMAPRTKLRTFTGGDNRGDPCDGLAYHGFNGMEREVVAAIAAFVLAR